MLVVREVIQSFYNGLDRKDDSWQENLSDDVLFSGGNQKLHEEGKSAFIQSYVPFLRSVESVQVKQIIVEGVDACAVVGYDYVSPTGAKLHQEDAEVWKVVEGKIVSLTIYFDITEYRNFMAA